MEALLSEKRLMEYIYIYILFINRMEALSSDEGLMEYIV